MKFLNKATAQATVEAVNTATTTVTDKVRSHFATHRNTYLGIGGGFVVGAVAFGRRDDGTAQRVFAFKAGDVTQTVAVYAQPPITVVADDK
jgi:hypothetical protein